MFVSAVVIGVTTFPNGGNVPVYLTADVFGGGSIGLGTSLLIPGTPASAVFLGLVAVSFLLFGLGVLVTVAPFARSFMARSTVEMTTAPEHRTTG
jgi:hypothetical protein